MSCRINKCSNILQEYYTGLERREGKGVDRECLIEIYHYTLICAIYCAAIEWQQRETSSATHTHSKAHACIHTCTRCASSGAVIEGVSVLVAIVQVLSAGLVCERSMTVRRPLIRRRAHINTNIDVTCSLGAGVIHRHSWTVPSPYICMHLKLRACHTPSQTYPALWLLGGARCPAPVLHRYLGNALMPAEHWWMLACLQGPLHSLGPRQRYTYTYTTLSMQI